MKLPTIEEIIKAEDLNILHKEVDKLNDDDLKSYLLTILDSNLFKPPSRTNCTFFVTDYQDDKKDDGDFNKIKTFILKYRHTLVKIKKEINKC